ncbi:MAG: MATE family efflux transporter [Clostridiales bacterium]|jgi:putative MATE family efflux protein|nr:MATE family efflux transporter [Clostridiales bacterium]
MSRALTRDMTEGNPAKLILKFSGPMLIGNIFQQLYNMVDSIVVGKFVSKDALAAVGATGSSVFLIFGLTFGLSAGISIVISQYFGAGDYESVKKSIATATYMILVAALIMGVVGYFISRPLLELLGTPVEIIDQSESYMKISFIGILGIASYNGIAAILRALGDAITPLIFLIVASIINVVLDLLFVIVFHWDIPGVAIATVISQVISGVGCIIYAYRKVELLRIPVKEFKPDREILSKCIRLGIPVALQNSFVSISMMALQFVINSFQATIMAAYTVVNRIEQLVMQPSMSLGAAVASFTGQNIGAGKIDRAKKGMRSSVLIILTFSLIMFPLMYFGGQYIMRLFTKKEDIDVVRYGVEGIRITSLFYSFLGLIFVTRNFLSGAGDIKIPIIMGLIEVVVRVAVSIYLSSIIGFHGIFWASALTWFATGVFGSIRVLSGKWMNKSVVSRST